MVEKDLKPHWLRLIKIVEDFENCEVTVKCQDKVPVRVVKIEGKKREYRFDERRIMREIKFRAWDKRDKIMIYPKIEGGEDFMLSLCMRLFEIHHGGELVEVSGRYVLMQYTGLTDCKGQEIYEGDIVEFTKIDNNEEFHPQPSKIFWNEELTGFVVNWRRPCDKKDLFCHLRTPGTNPKYLKIIGNIYENSELLKQAD